MSTAEEFNVSDFCKRHLLVKNWNTFKEQTYTATELTMLLQKVIVLFKKERTLAEIAPPVTIVGDIHGQFIDLVRLLNSRSTLNTTTRKQGYGFSAHRWVFLGDYVDRGPYSLECICLVFSLKVVFPDQYVLLRGNHETRAINFVYGFRQELLRRITPPKAANELWERFNEVFAWMPLACLVGRKILCMHGGIGPTLASLNSITNIQRPLVDVHTDRTALDLLWADPADGEFANGDAPAYIPNMNRGLSVWFNKAAVHDVCERLHLLLIVRAHQMMPAGFRFFADRKLCTIFSAPRYMNETDNDGVVMKVAANGKMNMVRMKKTSTAPIDGGGKVDDLTRIISDDIPSRSASLPVSTTHSS